MYTSVAVNCSVITFDIYVLIRSVGMKKQLRMIVAYTIARVYTPIPSLGFSEDCKAAMF